MMTLHYSLHLCSMSLFFFFCIPLAASKCVIIPSWMARLQATFWLHFSSFSALKKRGKSPKKQSLTIYAFTDCASADGVSGDLFFASQPKWSRWPCAIELSYSKLSQLLWSVYELRTMYLLILKGSWVVVSPVQCTKVYCNALHCLPRELLLATSGWILDKSLQTIQPVHCIGHRWTKG